MTMTATRPSVADKRARLRDVDDRLDKLLANDWLPDDELARAKRLLQERVELAAEIAATETRSSRPGWPVLKRCSGVVDPGSSTHGSRLAALFDAVFPTLPDDVRDRLKQYWQTFGGARLVIGSIPQQALRAGTIVLAVASSSDGSITFCQKLIGQLDNRTLRHLIVHETAHVDIFARGWRLIGGEAERVADALMCQWGYDPSATLRWQAGGGQIAFNDWLQTVQAPAGRWRIG